MVESYHATTFQSAHIANRWVSRGLIEASDVVVTCCIPQYRWGSMDIGGGCRTRALSTDGIQEEGNGY